MLLVVPCFGLFVKCAFVELVEQCEWTWFIVFDTVFVVVVFSVFVLDLAHEEYVTLFFVDFGEDIKLVGIVEVLGEVARLVGLVCEETGNFGQRGE